VLQAPNTALVGDRSLSGKDRAANAKAIIPGLRIYQYLGGRVRIILQAYIKRRHGEAA
jgi:hypothetical protein